MASTQKVPSKNPYLINIFVKKYIGKSEIDWDQAIKNLAPTERIYESTPSDYQEKDETETAFKFVGDIIDFQTFHSGFDDTNKEFGNYVGAEPVMCWISEMKTGFCVPPHSDDYEINNTIGDEPRDNFVRYHCHISKPCMGSTFIIEKDCYHMEEQGAVYQWKKIDEIHCGFNIGKQTKYTYHFIGKKKDGPSYHHFY